METRKGSQHNPVIEYASSAIGILQKNRLYNLLSTIVATAEELEGEGDIDVNVEDGEELRYMHNLKHIPGLKVCILTIGSRGDIQPYMALGKGLQAVGYVVRIGTHKVYKEWVESQGFEFRPLAGDPEELMNL